MRARNVVIWIVIALAIFVLAVAACTFALIKIGTNESETSVVVEESEDVTMPTQDIEEDISEVEDEAEEVEGPPIPDHYAEDAIPDRYQEGFGEEYVDTYSPTIFMTNEEIGSTDIFVDWFQIPETAAETDYPTYQVIICTLGKYLGTGLDDVYTCDINLDVHDSVNPMVYEIYVHGPKELNLKMNHYDLSVEVEELN